MKEDDLAIVRWYQTEVSITIATNVKPSYIAEARIQNGKVGIDFRSIETGSVETLAFVFPLNSIEEKINSTFFNEKENIFLLNINKLNNSGHYLRLEPNELRCICLPKQAVIKPKYEGWDPEELIDSWNDNKLHNFIRFSDKKEFENRITLDRYKLKANYNTVIATLEFSNLPDNHEELPIKKEPARNSDTT